MSAPLAVLVRVRNGVHERRCTKCLCWLPREAFGAHARNSSGLRPNCRKCVAAAQKVRAAQPDRPKRVRVLVNRPIGSAESAAVAHVWRGVRTKGAV